MPEHSSLFTVHSSLPVRRDIAGLAEYEPVQPITAQAARLGIAPERIAKLDGNENPYGPSPHVAEALARTAVHLYPDPFHTELRAAVASYAGAPAERIMFGNGSDELLELVLRLVLEPGDSVISCEPTFGMYSFLPPLFLGQVVRVDRRDDFSVDVDAVLRALTPRTKLVILATPNNPTGNLLPEPDVRRILDSGRLVVLDEAYIEFAAPPAASPDSGLPTPGPSAMPLTAQHDNLVVLRTFSKWAGLAGLRVGYGAFPTQIIRHLWKIKQPYNVNVAAAAGVLASLQDRDYLMENVRKIVAERERMGALLSQVPGWRVYPSSANFVLCRVPDARQAKQRLWAQGIMVRSYFGCSGLEDCLRVSVGLPEHTDRLCAALTAAQQP